jgi:hypothetical protein
MATRGYSLQDCEKLVNVLSWRIDARESAGYAVEAALAGALDRELHEASSRDEAVSRMVDSLSEATKYALVRHPHVAGHLQGEFRMSPEQLLLFVARYVVTTSRKTQATTHGEGARVETGDLPFRCIFSNDDYVPLLQNGQEFTFTLGADAVVKTLSKLRRALDTIAVTSPPTSSAVTSYIWQLALKGNFVEKNAFSSRSFPQLPGLAVLCNPHLERACQFYLEEGLIHESIHLLLFFAELPGSRLLRSSSSYAQSVLSPWSGHRLELYRGTHALLVWLSLVKYWRLAAERPAGSERMEFIGKRLAFLDGGFLSPIFPAFLGTVRDEASPATRAVVESMYDDYLSRPRCA